MTAATKHSPSALFGYTDSVHRTSGLDGLAPSSHMAQLASLGEGPIPCAGSSLPAPPDS